MAFTRRVSVKITAALICIFFSVLSLNASAGHHGGNADKAKQVMDKAHAKDTAAEKSSDAYQDKKAATEAQAELPEQAEAVEGGDEAQPETEESDADG